MPLTDTKLRNLKRGRGKARNADGGGLYIRVTDTGSKLWRMAIRVQERKTSGTTDPASIGRNDYKTCAERSNLANSAEVPRTPAIG